MQTKNISFTSKIHFINPQEFDRLSRGWLWNRKACVDYPWTKKQIVRARSSYTREIRTCTAGGITGDKRVIMFHLDPGNKINFTDFEDTIRVIDRKSPPNSNKGLLLGSKYYIHEMTGETVTISRTFFEKVKKALQHMNLSIFQEMESWRECDLLHIAPKDTWFISAKKQDNDTWSVKTLKDLKAFFAHISIAPYDELFIEGIEISKKLHPELFRQ